jgi:hypothetical protein
MPLRLPRVVKAAALTFVGAVALGWPTGDRMAHAQGPVQMQSFALPWKGTEDEIVVNLAIGSLRDSLAKWLASERGVHAETLLVSIGAIAGFAAQCAVNERIRKRDIPGATTDMPGPELSKLLHDRGLAVSVTAKSGETYVFGDLINGYLVRQPTTVDQPLFAFLAAAAIEAGVKPAELQDVVPMFAHASKTIGTPEYGILHPPPPLAPQLTPREALARFWLRVRLILERTDGQGVVAPAAGRNVRPEYWPLVTALVARQFLLWTKDTIDPRTGLALVMESAIVMSKVDPKSVPQEPSDTPRP